MLYVLYLQKQIKNIKEHWTQNLVYDISEYSPNDRKYIEQSNRVLNKLIRAYRYHTEPALPAIGDIRSNEFKRKAS